MKPEGNRFSLVRWWSVVLKEFLQLRRDRVTFAMMIGIPIMQLILFGFAINADPRHLLTGVIAADQSDVQTGIKWSTTATYPRFSKSLN